MLEMVGVERTSSIENEPRTLKFEQIHMARDAARYVMNTRSFEEALRIFTEGLIPVISCVQDEKDTTMDYTEGVGSLGDRLKLRSHGDIASAPF